MFIAVILYLIVVSREMQLPDLEDIESLEVVGYLTKNTESAS